MPRHAILLILCLACTAGPVPVVADVAAAPPARENTVRIEIPLVEGRLRFGDLLGRLCDAVSLPRPAGLKELDFSIDAGSTLGRLKIEAIGQATSGAVQINIRENRNSGHTRALRHDRQVGGRRGGRTRLRSQARRHSSRHQAVEPDARE